jgi:acetyl-CoA decarbonylase/synthase complex subunit gamma
MVIEEIDLYKMRAEDLMNYLPDGGQVPGGAGSWEEFAQMLIDRKAKASGCKGIGKDMAAAIDAVLAIDIRLPESDPMQEKVKQNLFEYNSPTSDSPIVLTGNSVVTHRILKLVFDATKVKAYVIPIDTNGYTLDNAVVTGHFTPMGVMKAISDSRIIDKNPSRRAVISGLAKDLKGNIERMSRWNLEIGPVSGFELPLYLIGAR